MAEPQEVHDRQGSGGEEHDRGILHRLTALLGPEAVATGGEAFEEHRRDRALVVEAGRPLAVVWPSSTEEVQGVVRIAGDHGAPIVTRGAGSGLAGGANAVDGAIVLSLDRMNRILELDPDNLIAQVQPGVLTAELKKAAAEHDLWYPPDPASTDFSTIGGNIATNAGGMSCVKYGVTRDWVLGLEIVTADARVLEIGRRTIKGVTGYDLVGLIVGSEGTLAIVTRATLRLRPRPGPVTTLVAAFPDLDAAGRAIAAITRELVPSMLEILDEVTVEAVRETVDLDVAQGAAALLLAQSDQPQPAGEQEIQRIAELCEQAGATSCDHSSDPQRAEDLLAARREAFPALERRGDVLLDDLSVPPAKVVDLLAATRRISAERQVTIATFGHAGDGNMHPTIVYDAEDAESTDAAHAAFDELCSVALELGGTLSGEHGIGALKRRHLPQELGPEVLALHRRIKEVLDPRHLLNPGKAV